MDKEMSRLKAHSFTFTEPKILVFLGEKDAQIGYKDLTWVILFYEIHEISVWWVSQISSEMTTLVRFWLSNDCFEQCFIDLIFKLI